MKSFGSFGLGSVGLGVVARCAFGHPGHGVIDFGGGVVHPLTGVDHLAAMMAVGMWGSLMGKRGMWMLPLAFVAMMAVGAAMGMSGVAVPGVEQGIAASVLVLGLLITFGLWMPMWGGVGLVGLFAVFHGWAHGHEMAAGTSGAAYAAGFVMSTMVLHGVGIGLGVLLVRIKRLDVVRFAGGTVAVIGALLIAGVL
ncbi:MAG: HupE/UreJ family protein [Phycisphaerae bacterium]